MSTATRWMELYSYVDSFLKDGRYNDAIEMAKKSLELAEHALFPKNNMIAASVDKIALIYFAIGQYKLAEPYLLRALAMREKQFGSDHVNVVSSLNNLALLYKSQGQYELAESYYFRASRNYYLAYPQCAKDHLADWASTIDNQAMLFYEQGKYAKAEEEFKFLRSILWDSLVLKHPDVAAKCLSTLSAICRKTGRTSEAEAYEKQAANIRANKR